jgi:hypothetical protein
MPGDIGDVDMPLLEESFRRGDNATPFEVEISSSELSEIDLGLGVLCEKGDRGGASAAEL